MTDNNDPLLFAIPKKGRLYDQCVSLLKGAGLQYNRPARLDIAMCSNLPIKLVFLPASDIGRYVGEGNVDMGITGQDTIAEAGVKVEELMPLGFGSCRLAVQAPVANKVTDVSSLAGGRIVTSFSNLARKYFDKFDKEKGTTTSIKYVSGSVEAACGLGLADAVVDLVETGTTMRAAGLEIVEEILTTQAVLISNPKCQHPALVSKIFKRIEGYLTATKFAMINYNVPRDLLSQAEKITPGKTSPTVMPLEDSTWVAVSAMVLKKETAEIMDKLQELGAKDILLFDIANCRCE